MLLPISALAVTPPSGTCGENNNITWILQNDGTLLLSGTGNTPVFAGNYFADPAPWTPYSDQIQRIRIGEGITGINNGAFETCSSATSITLSASLQFFATGAWPAGDSLQYVITDPNSTNYIAYGGVLYAEHPATGEWEVGEGVPSLVYYPPALKYESTTSYTVRAGTQAIAYPAFGGNKFLKAVSLPDSVQEICYDAFARCSSLETIQLSNRITEIPSGAFRSCISLKELTLPSGLKTIETSAFWYCNKLEKIIVPASVTDFNAKVTPPDGGTSDYNLHKDFYFCGDAPTFDIDNGELSTADMGDIYALIRTDIYYPDTASGWQNVIEQYKEDEKINFIPYTLENSEVKYTVSYNLAGGSGEAPSTQNYKAGETVTLSSITPVKDGYTFTGWSDGNRTYQAGQTFTMPEMDVSLTAVWTPKITSTYSVDKAIEYAKQNWNSGKGLCAEFVSRCVRAGGLDIDIKAGTGSCYREISKKSGLSMQQLVTRTDSQGRINVYQSDNIDRLAPGDVVIQWCKTHNIAPHVLICGGFNLNGAATFYAHNGAKNNQTFRFDYKYYKTDADVPYQHTRNCDMTAYVIHLSSLDSNIHINQLTSARIKSDCPVELLVTIDGNVIDSRTINGNYTEPSTGTKMIASGSGDNRAVEVNIPGEYIQNRLAYVEFFGTDVGTMSLTVELTYENNKIEEYTFQNISISETVTGYLEDMQPGQMVRLIKQDNVVEENSLEEVWIVYPGETISAATPSRISDEEKVDNAEERDETEDFVQPTLPNSGSSDSDPTYSITVPSSITGGTVKITPTSASERQRVTITVKANLDYELDELIVTDSKGNKLKLTDKGDGKYTFTMPASQVTVAPVFVKSGAPASMPFTDVPSGAFYAAAVQWAVEKGITAGTSTATFSPDAPCTRAQIVTFLWRAAGSPRVSGNTPFTDVASGSLYYDAVLWAVSNGITAGTSASIFSPDDTCTRAQAVSFLYRYEKSPAASGGSSFADVDAGAYYANAVSWAVGRGVTVGTSATTFGPDDTCTRGQIVTFLYRDMA